MERRTFLKHGTLALGASLWGCAGAPGIRSLGPASRDPYARVGMTTVGWRSRFASTRSMNGGPVTTPELTLLAAPQVIADEVGLHNVEIWDMQFADMSLAYCEQIRAAAAKAGSRIVNIQVDKYVGDLSATDATVRAKNIADAKGWLDRAVAVGAPSIRVNTGRFNPSTTVDSFRQLADYGQKVGATVLVENHGTPIPDVVSIVSAVNHPRCRSLVDWGNTAPNGAIEEKIAGLRPMFPWLGFVSAKAEEFDDQYHHTSWDIGPLVRATEDAGYRGIYSIELWNTKNPPADTARAARTVRDAIVANLKA
jgi:sugar phosphate isomerase/epimerase